MHTHTHTCELIVIIHEFFWVNLMQLNSCVGKSVYQLHFGNPSPQKHPPVFILFFVIMWLIYKSVNKIQNLLVFSKKSPNQKKPHCNPPPCFLPIHDMDISVFNSMQIPSRKKNYVTPPFQSFFIHPPPPLWCCHQFNMWHHIRL